eukprot:gene25108-biopygen20948
MPVPPPLDVDASGPGPGTPPGDSGDPAGRSRAAASASRLQRTPASHGRASRRIANYAGGGGVPSVDTRVDPYPLPPPLWDPKAANIPGRRKARLGRVREPFGDRMPASDASYTIDFEEMAASRTRPQPFLAVDASWIEGGNTARPGGAARARATSPSRHLPPPHTHTHTPAVALRAHCRCPRRQRGGTGEAGRAPAPAGRSPKHQLQGAGGSNSCWERELDRECLHIWRPACPRIQTQGWPRGGPQESSPQGGF